jgi:hypothetical protein
VAESTEAETDAGVAREGRERREKDLGRCARAK